MYVYTYIYIYIYIYSQDPVLGVNISKKILRLLSETTFTPYVYKV